MSKRMTETSKWGDAWFMDLPIKWKLAWFWIVDNCDHAGVIEANPRLMAFMIGEPIDGDEFIRAMQGRVIKPRAGKWFIPKFIEFQYGESLNMKNSAHKGVVKKLREADIECPVPVIDAENEAPSKPLQSPSVGAQDKDKDKDKDTDKAKIMPEIPEPINTPKMQVAWAAWLDFRNSVKKPVNPHGARQSMKDFVSWGEKDSVQSIEDSIRNGWQGLFAPKSGARQQPKTNQQHQPAIKFV